MNLEQYDIYSPVSKELQRQEDSIVRYLDKEFQRLKSSPINRSELDVASDEGVLFLETDDLISSHYDEDLRFFESFLDTKYHTYTMAYYGEDGSAKYSLVDAQEHKFSLISNRAKIKDGQRILNIGCGFGSFEKYLFERYPNIHVTGVTPSKIQADFLRDNFCNNSSYKARFTLIEKKFDENLVNELGGSSFDLVVSIGVLEQLNNMKSMLELISHLLAPKGRTFHHFITSSVLTPEVSLGQKALIGKYFPGGRAWPHDEFVKYADNFKHSEDWFINGASYYRTLEEWHLKFWGAIPSLMSAGFKVERIKHWNDYFMLCKCMFRSGSGDFYGVSHYLFEK